MSDSPNGRPTPQGRPSPEEEVTRRRRSRAGAAAADRPRTAEEDTTEPLALERGRGDAHVELGGIGDIDDGDTIALRHYAEQGGSGLPSMHVADQAAEAGEETKGRLARMRDELRTYGELRRTPWGLTPFVILTLIGFAQRFESQAFFVAGPDIVKDLNIPINDLIGLSALISLVGIFAALLAGYWADRVRRVPFVAVGTTLSGVAGFWTTFAGNYGGLAWPRVLDDSAEITADVPRFSLLADYYPPEARGRVFAGLSTMSRLAAVVAIFASGAAVQWLGWRTAGRLFAIPLVLLGAVVLLRLREPVRGYMERRALGADEDEARTESDPMSFGEGWRATWSIRTVRRVFIGNAISSAAVGFSLYYPFFLFEEYGLNAFERSLIGLPSLLTGILGGLYGGALIDRLTRRNPGRVVTIYGAFATIAAVGSVIYGIKPPIVVLIVGTMIFSAGFALTGPAVSLVFSQVIPANIRTQGIQVTNLALLPGIVIFVPLYQRIFADYGYSAVLLLDIPFLLVAAIVYMTAGGFFDLDARSAFAASLADQEWKRARADGKAKLLVCRDIDVEYSGVQVLFGVDFDVKEGEIIALLGTNGAGKSTLLRAISGTQEASGGAIVFDGRDITHMPPHEIAGRGVIHMPGGRGVFPGLTVRDNLVMANWLADDPAEVRERLREVFEIFPILRERADVEASLLSGGEQQQLSLAQAFLAKPKLLMIDELSLGLSPAVVAQLLDIVREIHKRGVTIIVVEQSVNVALTIAQKAIFMEKGEVKFFGNTADLLNRPDILRAVYVKGSGALTSGGAAGAQRTERRRRELELAEAQPILQVRELVKRYGGVTAVDGVSFDLRDGEVLGLIGPNGAGKTTVFEMISGFQLPDEGRIGFQGVDITDLSPERRAEQGLIRRFQDARLFPSLTVFETLLVALEQQLEVKSGLLNAFAMPQARRAEKRLQVRAERLIELLELGSYRDKFVKELSTGLRRIVDLACVLATEPKLLLLDEPSSGIAQAESESLAPLLRRVRFETGCSILIIEHDMPLISAVSDELIALERGRLIIRGRPEAVLNDERVIESYLGTTEAAVKRSGR